MHQPNISSVHPERYVSICKRCETLRTFRAALVCYLRNSLAFSTISLANYKTRSLCVYENSTRLFVAEIIP